jgi:hypothetical protein
VAKDKADTSAYVKCPLLCYWFTAIGKAEAFLAASLKYAHFSLPCLPEKILGAYWTSFRRYIILDGFQG